MWAEHTTAAWRPVIGAAALSASEEKLQEVSRWRRSVFLLRARMLAFVQQLLAFVTAQVLEPNWRRLEAALARVGTVDALLRAHVDFLDTCLKECMLTSEKLIKVSPNHSIFLNLLTTGALEL